MNDQISLRPCVTEEEFLLAQLACKKLVKLLQGTISVGISLQTSGMSDPAVFFAEGFEVLRSFAGVLHAVAGPIPSTKVIIALRQQTSALLELLRQIEGKFSRILPSESEDSRLTNEVGQLCEELFALLQELARQLEIDPDAIDKARTVCLAMLASMPSKLVATGT